MDKRLIMRLGALPVQISCEQLKLGVFKALAAHMYTKRIQKRSLLVRTFKNLKVNKERLKLLGDLTVLAK